jgi:hypothetical protein
MPRPRSPSVWLVAEPTDDQLWRGVEHTVRHVLLPAIDDEWARAAASQLVGLARYAATRPNGRVDANTAELARVLATLADNPIVGRVPLASESAVDVFAAVGAALAAAVDDDGPDGDEIRAVLRPVVTRQLDDELAVTSPLIPYFRGQVDG